MLIVINITINRLNLNHVQILYYVFQNHIVKYNNLHTFFINTY